MTTTTNNKLSFAEFLKNNSSILGTDAMILNNNIIPELTKKGFYFEEYNNEENENGEYKEVYQTYIIDPQDIDEAIELIKTTNQVIYYNEDLDLVLLGITHFGTMWSGQYNY